MPQFDSLSYLNQVIWFMFVFLSFYFLITYFFLTFLCTILKFRKKKISNNHTTISKLFSEYFFENFPANTNFKKRVHGYGSQLQTLYNKIEGLTTTFFSKYCDISKIKLPLNTFWLRNLTTRNLLK